MIWKILIIWTIIAVIYLTYCNMTACPDEEDKLLQLEPETKIKVIELLEFVRTLDKFKGYKIIVAETWRSEERQDELYLAGGHLTQVRGGYSWHNYGRAVDLYFIKEKRILEYEEAPYQELGELGEDLGFVWGGRFSFRDYGHFQYQWCDGQKLSIEHLKEMKEND